jgi:hypothetical protein
MIFPMKLISKLVLLVSGVAALALFSGCVSKSKKRDFEPTVVRFFVESPGGEAFSTATLPTSGVSIAVNSKPIIVETDIVRVDVSRGEFGAFLVFYLTQSAARDAYRLTGINQGRRLVIVINDQPLGARVIDRPFGEGIIATYVEVPEDQLAKLVKGINGTSIELQKEIAKQ